MRDTTETVRAAAASVPIVGYVAYAPADTDEALMPYLAPGTPLSWWTGPCLPHRAWRDFAAASCMQSRRCSIAATLPPAC